MSPPPGFRHVSNVAKITSPAEGIIAGWPAFSETPVLTSDGIKVPDATWVSAVYARELEAQRAVGAGARPGNLRGGALAV